VSHEEAVNAAKAGLLVEHSVPCSKDDPHARPDLNRAIRVLHESTPRKP